MWIPSSENHDGPFRCSTDGRAAWHEAQDASSAISVPHYYGVITIPNSRLGVSTIVGGSCFCLSESSYLPLIKTPEGPFNKTLGPQLSESSRSKRYTVRSRSAPKTRVRGLENGSGMASRTNLPPLGFESRCGWRVHPNWQKLGSPPKFGTACGSMGDWQHAGLPTPVGITTLAHAAPGSRMFAI